MGNKMPFVMPPNQVILFEKVRVQILFFSVQLLFFLLCKKVLALFFVQKKWKKILLSPSGALIRLRRSSFLKRTILQCCYTT